MEQEAFMSGERAKLIKALEENHCPVCRDCPILEAVDEYVKREVLADRKRILEEIEKPLKELSMQFEYFKAYQNENLVYGQTLKTASENWNEMINPTLDFGKIDEALSRIQQHMPKG